MKKLIILIALAFAVAVTGPEIALTASPSPALAVVRQQLLTYHEKAGAFDCRPAWFCIDASSRLRIEQCSR